MSLLSKARELRIGLGAGRVTRNYPASPSPTPERFRGRPLFDGARCVGCAACANHCPAREILVFDPCQEIRVLKYLGRRCTYCGRCAEVCPEGAIRMSREFEIATPRISDLRQRLELFMSTCNRCGRCFTPATLFDRLKLQGYRCDDVVHDRWVFRSRPWLDDHPVTDDVRIDLD